MLISKIIKIINYFLFYLLHLVLIDVSINKLFRQIMEINILLRSF